MKIDHGDSPESVQQFKSVSYCRIREDTSIGTVIVFCPIIMDSTCSIHP